MLFQITHPHPISQVHYVSILLNTVIINQKKIVIPLKLYKYHVTVLIASSTMEINIFHL